MIRSPKFIAAAAAAIAVLAFLAFGVFGIHTAFIDETVSEDNPFAAALAAPEPDGAAGSSSAADSANDEPAVQADAEPAIDETIEEAVADEPDQPQAEPEAEAEPAPEEPAAPQIVTLGTGTLVDHDHSGTGTATVLTDGTSTFLRFEDDFAVDNGPDLNVYLVRGADAEGDPGLFDDDFIDLGDLKGNVGAQNYEIPAGVDISEYNTVAIWCVRFGVAFNAANLA